MKIIDKILGYEEPNEFHPSMKYKCVEYQSIVDLMGR